MCIKHIQTQTGSRMYMHISWNFRQNAKRNNITHSSFEHCTEISWRRQQQQPRPSRDCRSVPNHTRWQAKAKRGSHMTKETSTPYTDLLQAISRKALNLVSQRVPSSSRQTYFNVDQALWVADCYSCGYWRHQIQITSWQPLLRITED